LGESSYFIVVHKSFIEKVILDELILSRLMPNEDLFTSLKKICKDQGVETGVILSAIGSFKNVAFGNVKINVDIPVKLEGTNEMGEAGPFELLSLEGNLFPPGREENPVIHLHVMLGSPFRECYGRASL
jgi:predicted DNA-binding protein with PD1-like motif